MTKKAATSQGVSPRTGQANKPPVVAVLGHVDHGKTTLLDFIRKANVASREHGGITQHIGAYQIAYKTKTRLQAPEPARQLPDGSSRMADGRSDGGQGKEDRLITFIDTPGHEAFSKIRSRGASAADIAILVVAANDSVKPQTIESIAQIQAAGIPMIVAINKIDLPGVIIDKVKSDLAKHGVQVEGFGGDVPCVLVSAKEGKGIPDLLELILLIADMKELSGDPAGPFTAVVIEAKVDKFRGQVATILVKTGTIGVGTVLFEGDTSLGRVRALFDESGAKVEAALPGKPVEVLGFTSLPSVGVLVSSVSVASTPIVAAKPKDEANVTDFLAAMTAADKKRLKLLIKADTSGSLEAVLEALPKSDIDVVSASLGDITESDVLEARASNAVIVGFSVKAGSGVEKLATHEKVIYRTYSIIYELLDEMKDVVTGMEALLVRERQLGTGQIIAEFPYEKDRIAGTKVASGRLAKGDMVRIMRGEEEIGTAKIKSIRQGKNEITKVEVGGECGVLLDKKVDFTLQDVIIAFTTG